MSDPVICFGQQPCGFFPKRFFHAKVVTALQEHATEVDELVREGMAAMMRGMMARTGGSPAQR